MLRFHVFRFVPYHCSEKSMCLLTVLGIFDSVFINNIFIHFLTLVVMKKEIHFIN